MPRKTSIKSQHGTSLKLLHDEQIRKMKKYLQVTVALALTFSFFMSIWIPAGQVEYGILRFMGITALTWAYFNMLIVSSVKMKYRKRIEGPHSTVLRHVALTSELAIVEVLVAGVLMVAIIAYLKYILYVGQGTTDLTGLIKLGLIALLSTVALTLSTEVLVGAYSLIANKPSPTPARQAALASSLFIITILSPVQEILTQAAAVPPQAFDLLAMLYGSWLIVFLSETFLKRPVPNR